MLKEILFLFCLVCLIFSEAQSEPAFTFGDTVTQGAQKSNGRDGDKRDGKDDEDEDDDDDSSGGDDSGSGSENDSDEDSDDDDNSGSGNGGNSDDNDDNDDNSGSGGGDNNSDDNEADSEDDSGDGGNEGDGDDNGSGNDDDDDNSGNGGGDDSDNEDNDDGSSGKGDDDNVENDNSGKGKEDDYERRYYVGAVSASDGKSVLMGGTRLESSSPWLEILSTGVWFEAYGYWQGNSFVAEDITILEDEAWSYFRGPASLVGVRAKGNVEVWTKTSGVDTRLTSSEQVRLVAYFDGSQYRSLPGGLTPPTANVPTGWVELTGMFDGQSIVWDEARAFP
jgi:hypothetical protein